LIYRAKDIRIILFKFLKEEYKDIYIMEEKEIYKSIVDIFCIKGNNLLGLEIKSDTDSLKRLPRQVKNYDKIFDFNIVVITEKWVEKVKDILPKHWGIFLIKEDSCEIIKSPLVNPNRDEYKLSWLLWKPECRELLKRNNLLRGFSYKAKKYLNKRIASKIKIDNIKEYLIECFLKRDWDKVKRL